MTDPLELPLRAIHYPAPVSWWPPAPGWWLLAALVLATLVAGWWWWRRLQARRLTAVAMARAELTLLESRYREEKDVVALVRQLSILLRRLGISLYPRAEVASLTGESWLAFLDRDLPERPFTQGPGRLLLDAPYRRDPDLGAAEELIRICRLWIDRRSAVRKRR